MWVPVCGGHILLEAGSREQNINGKFPPPVSLEGGNARENFYGPSGLIFCRLAFAVYVSRSGESPPEMEMFNFHFALRAGPEGEGDPPPEMEMFNFHFALWAGPGGEGVGGI